MGEPRRVTKLCIVALVAVAVALALLLFPPWAAITWEQWGAAAAIATCVVVAWFFPLDFAFKTKLYLDAVPLLVAVLLLPPGIAMVVVGPATVAARVLRPSPFDWAEAGFNGSQTALQAAVGGLLLARAGWDPSAPLPASPSWQIVAVAAGAAMWVVSTTLVTVVAGLDAGLPIRSWPRLGFADAPIDGLAHMAQVGVALAVVILAAEQPWLGLALAPAVVAVYSATYHHLGRRRRAAEAQRERDASAATAQRLAALGSWRWDVASGQLSWSDETFQILGFAAQSFTPTPEVFFTCVHPDDRIRVERTLRQAAVERHPDAIDFGVIRSDGTERYVTARWQSEDSGAHQATLVGTLQDVTERERLTTELVYRASHDPLTGLPDRDEFLEHGAKALAAEAEGSAAVFAIDLDELGVVNAVLGEEAGDRILQATAERLRQSVRSADVVARLGSDEFAVLVVGHGAEGQGARLGERIGETLRWPSIVGGREVQVTASIGVAVGAPGASDLRRLLLGANTALKQAKAAGGNRCVVDDGMLDGETALRLEMQGALARAVDRGRIRMRYQPQVDLATGAVVGVDVVPHWHHPDYGELRLASFPALAPKNGLPDRGIGEILSEVCLQAALWQRQLPGRPGPRISVHLPEETARDGALGPRVETVARNAGLPTKAIELVFPPGLIHRESASIGPTLRALRAFGVRCVVGERGLQNGVLGSIARLELDGVRLDVSLVAAGEEDARALIVADSLIGLARQLGMTVTGTGIGTPEALSRARTMGCDIGQGELFDPPLPGPEIGDLLAKGVVYPVLPDVIAISSHRRKRRSRGDDRAG